MKTETAYVDSLELAYEQCPWAATFRLVDDGDGGEAYKMFESVEDARLWDASV